MPIVPKGGGDNYGFFMPEMYPNKHRKVNESSSNGICCVLQFPTARHMNNTERTMKYMNPFYIQKALGLIERPVTNALRLQDSCSLSKQELTANVGNS
jgi:hypothetical protein